MPLEPRKQAEQFVTDRLINQTNTAEGAILPPRVIGGLGGFRVPYVSTLKVLRSINLSTGTQITMGWTDPVTDPSNPISHYLIHVYNLKSSQGLSTSLANKVVAMNPVIANSSPATIIIQGDASQRVTLTVQTVLKSGQTSEVDESPTVTVRIASSNGSVSKAFADSGYTASDAYLILWNTTGGNCVQNLPPAIDSSNRTFAIKKTDSTTNIVTITPNGSDTIQGTSTFILSAPRQTATIYCDGTSWHILSLTIV